MARYEILFSSLLITHGRYTPGDGNSWLIISMFTFITHFTIDWRKTPLTEGHTTPYKEEQDHQGLTPGVDPV